MAYVLQWVFMGDYNFTTYGMEAAFEGHGRSAKLARI